MPHDTTGQHVLTYPSHLMGTRAIVAVDLGPYPNTREELNVRRLECLSKPFLLPVDLHQLPGYPSGYGCGWSTGRLYPLTPDKAAALVAEANAVYCVEDPVTGERELAEDY